MGPAARMRVVADLGVPAMRKPEAADVTAAPGEAVRLRLHTLNDVLAAMKQARAQQADSAAPSTKRGVWVSQALWRAARTQLEGQVAEVLGWEQLVLKSQKEVEELRGTGHVAAHDARRTHGESQRQAADLSGQLDALQEELAEQKEAWAEEKAEHEARVEELLRVVQEGEALVADGVVRDEALQSVRQVLPLVEQRAVGAEGRAEELQDKLDKLTASTQHDHIERDALSAQVGELSAALSEARSAAERLRYQLAQRQRPLDEVVRDVGRLQADNERLVALLASTREYSALAADMAVGGSGGAGVHYLPLSECLVQKGLVDTAYDPLLDRELKQRRPPGGAASKGGRDSSGAAAAAALDHDLEEWHWVPRQAVEATRALLRAQLPSAPAGPFMHLLLQLNKIWRQAEAVHLAAHQARHDEELREVHRLYRQRAPYEAVVAGQKLSTLKRQVRLGAQHAQHLVGEAKTAQRSATDDSKMILTLGLDSISTLTKQLGKALSRNKRQAQELGRRKWAAGHGAHGNTAQAPPPDGYCPACVDRLLVSTAIELGGQDGGRVGGRDGGRVGGRHGGGQSRTHIDRLLAAAPPDALRDVDGYTDYYAAIHHGEGGGGGGDGGGDFMRDGGAGSSSAAVAGAADARRGDSGSFPDSGSSAWQGADSRADAPGMSAAPAAAGVGRRATPGFGLGGATGGEWAGAQTPPDAASLWGWRGGPQGAMQSPLSSSAGAQSSGGSEATLRELPARWGGAEVLTVVHEGGGGGGSRASWVAGESPEPPSSSGGSAAAGLGDALVVRFARHSASRPPSSAAGA